MAVNPIVMNLSGFLLFSVVYSIIYFFIHSATSFKFANHVAISYHNQHYKASEVDKCIISPPPPKKPKQQTTHSQKTTTKQQQQNNPIGALGYIKGVERLICLSYFLALKVSCWCYCVVSDVRSEIHTYKLWGGWSVHDWSPGQWLPIFCRLQKGNRFFQVGLFYNQPSL